MTKKRSCDGDYVLENPLAGRLDDNGLTCDEFRPKENCMDCTRKQGKWNYFLTLSLQRLQTTWEAVPTTMSSRTLASRTVFIWTLFLIMMLSCGVRAAPEAFHRRQGDLNVVYPAAELHDMKDLGLTETFEDPKHREEMAALIELLEKFQIQQQAIEDERNGVDSGIPPASEGYPNLPIPIPLQAKYFRSQDGVSKDEMKRGSYFPSLCHFKICNMGRIRNPPLKP